MTQTDLPHEYVNAIGATIIQSDSEGCVDFRLHGCEGYVRVKNGGSRLRANIQLAIVDDLEQTVAWIDSQPWPPSSELEVRELENGTCALRLVWERSLESLVGQVDPIASEIEAFVKARHAESIADIPEGTFDMMDPRDSEPEQAWLVIGSEVSWPSEDELVSQETSGYSGIFECLWTAAKQTQAGDLMLVYFMGDFRAVCFVARAASAAFYASDIEVNGKEDLGNERWWVYLTPLIEVSPIIVEKIRDACDGQLILRGQSGKFLHPDAIERLSFIATDPEQQPEIDRIVRKPVGRADLPDPDSMTWEDVRDLAGGALRLESEVSRYIVEPLLRRCLKDARGAMTFVPEYPIGKKRADYVVLKGDRPVCVVEVKLAINDGGGWSKSPDLQQAIGYAKALKCAAVLIDANRIVLIDADSTTPRHIIQRRLLDCFGFGKGNLIDLAEHLGVAYLHRANQGGEYRQPAADFFGRQSLSAKDRLNSFSKRLARANARRSKMTGQDREDQDVTSGFAERLASAQATANLVDAEEATQSPDVG